MALQALANLLERAAVLPERTEASLRSAGAAVLTADRLPQSKWEFSVQAEEPRVAAVRGASYLAQPEIRLPVQYRWSVVSRRATMKRDTRPQRGIGVTGWMLVELLITLTLIGIAGGTATYLIARMLRTGQVQADSLVQETNAA